MFTIPDKVYDALKWAILIAIPALITLVTTLGTIYGFDTDIITLTISALTTFVGTLIGVSTVGYKVKNGAEK